MMNEHSPLGFPVREHSPILEVAKQSQTTITMFNSNAGRIVIVGNAMLVSMTFSPPFFFSLLNDYNTLLVTFDSCWNTPHCLNRFCQYSLLDVHFNSKVRNILAF